MYKRGELLHKSLNGGMSVETPKFKIESTIVALHIIEQNDYMFSFNGLGMVKGKKTRKRKEQHIQRIARAV